MKFAICNEIFQGWKLDEAMRFAANTGYDAIEIAPFTLAKYVTDIPPAQRREIVNAAARAGIAISGIHWVLVQTEGLHLTHPDTAIRDRTSKYFGELVNFCADLGGRFIIVGSPKQRNIVPGVTPEQACEWTADLFRAPVALAEKRGVTICIEPLAPAETNFLNTAADTIALTERLPSPSFKMMLDVKAMSSESKPIPQIIRESFPHFRYFHANDSNLKGPGFGDVDFKPIAEALHGVGYDGFVSVEVFIFDEGPEVIATRSLDYLKSVFGAAPAPLV